MTCTAQAKHQATAEVASLFPSEEYPYKELTMTAQETHPGLLAIDQQAKFVVRRNRAKELREQAASLRREAKATKLSVDAAQLRREAKPLTDAAYGLELEAKAYKKKVVEHTAAATELLNKRMPPPSSPPGES